MKNKKSQPSSEEAYRLVYSSDPISKTAASAALPSGPLKPAIRIERKGRNGKTVTVVAKLPGHEKFLKELCASLKRSLGTGGSYALQDGQGVIEIQGDHRENIAKLIEAYQAELP